MVQYLRRKIVVFSITLLLLSNILIATASQVLITQNESDTFEHIVNEPLQENTHSILANSPQVFTENVGQLDNDNVRFYDQGGALWFTDDGLWIELREYAEPRGQGSQLRDQGGVRGLDFKSMESPESRVQSRESGLVTDDFRLTTNEYKRVVLKQEFVDANEVRLEGRDRTSWNSNFFYGNEPSKWCTDVPNYQEIFYKNIYDGIDLRYYNDQKGLKYDFIVHPGADIDRIRLRYLGAEELNIDEFGNLIIETELQALSDSKLLIYQDLNGYISEVLGSFRIYGKNTYGFEVLGDYNRNEILIIDPLIKLNFSTYIGGSGYEEGIDIVADSNGSSYLTGFTSSPNFPITTGVYDTSLNGGYFGDVFVLRLNENGSAPIYSTYIGGNSEEIGIGIVLDPSGNVFVAGQTSSSNFPITTGAFDTIYNGTYDGFILKLNQTGSRLIYSTFIGGEKWEVGFDIAIDATGNAFVTGATDSSDFPTTSGSYDTVLNNDDCFVVKLNKNGTGLIYSTLVGGSKVEAGYGIAVDLNGNAFVTGITNATDFPTTINAYDTSYNVNYDVFVFKINWNGTKLLYSTFVGGSSLEMGWAITIDPTGNSYVTGWTTSTSFPTTPTAYDSSINGDEDTIVFKLNWNGSKLLYSTYIGGSGADNANSIVLDHIGNVVVAGTTFSSNFPTTQGALDRVKNGSSDHFMFIFDIPNSTLEYSTYIGGSSIEHKSFDAYFTRGRVATNERGYVFVTGETTSTDLYTTPGVLDSTFNGKLDTFVVKFFIPPSFNITSLLLLKDDTPVTKIYAKNLIYTFRISITDSTKPSTLRTVHLHLDPGDPDLHFSWNLENDQFQEISDIFDHITLEPSSRAYKASWDKWTIDFDLTFNWTYPDEEFHDVSVIATNALFQSKILHSVNLYQVENDLDFNGDLLVVGDNDRTIEHNSTVVRGGEKLNWSGLVPVYEGTEDIYPPADEVDIMLWDELNNSWLMSPDMGQPFELETNTPKITRTNGYNYVINLTGIPLECDHTNKTFGIKIDSENVTFSNPTPDPNEWQNNANVNVGVTITDIGGGKVNNASVFQSLSVDNGTSWSAWEPISIVNPARKITVKNSVLLEDGIDNLAKWRAIDTLGNGPTESEAYRVLVDTENVTFSDPFPIVTEESPSEELVVGITIGDLTSGVDASRLSYCFSYNAGATWYFWRSVEGYSDGYQINVTLNLTFPNGTGNRIKWRAYDIAGNGPVVSEEYIIKVNEIIKPIIPKVQLLAPENNLTISTSSVELSWGLNNTGLSGVTYDVIFDSVYPPIAVERSNLDRVIFRINELEDNQTYYWTIVPKLNKQTGSCLSGIWSFSVNIPRPKPTVTLLSPKNGSIVQSLRPSLVWTVSYTGTEELTYDILMGKNNSLELEELDFRELSYLSKDALEFGETYYWQIMPFAGDHPGVESEVWQFTIRAEEYIPKFELELELYPSVVSLWPNETKYVTAIVRNLGELNDNISLSIPEVAQEGLEIEISQPIFIDLKQNGTAEFNITIRASADAKEDRISIIVVASSSNAAKYSQLAKYEETVTVNIMGKTTRGLNRSSTTDEYWIILLIIIIILIILAIVGLFLRRRKRSKVDAPDNTTLTSTSPAPKPAPKVSPAAASTPKPKPVPKATPVAAVTPTPKPVLKPIPTAAVTPTPNPKPVPTAKPLAKPISSNEQKKT